MRTVITLIAALGATAPCAAQMTYEVSGTYTLESGTDTLGLDGATFTLTVEIPCDAAPDFWTGPPDNSFHYAQWNLSSSTLVLSGTAGATYDGTYVESPGGALILRRGVIGANDFVEHLSPGFPIGGEDLDMDYQVHFPPGDFFPGIDPLEQAPYAMADVDFVNTWFTIEEIFGGDTVYVSTDLVATATNDCCVGDLDGGGGVGFGDLVALLAAWGPCVGCPEDLDGSGDVGFADLVIMLSAWGPCP